MSLAHEQSMIAIKANQQGQVNELATRHTQDSTLE